MAQIKKGDVFTVKGRPPDVDQDYDMTVMLLEDVVPGKTDFVEVVVLSSHMTGDIRGEYAKGSRLKWSGWFWAPNQENGLTIEPRSLTFRTPSTTE